MASKANGPIQVIDPNNQNFIYKKNGVNQPLLGNIGRTLQYQNNLGLTRLNHYTFTPKQERFVLDFLYYNHRKIYKKLMQYPYNIRHSSPQWHRINNTKNFSDLLIKAK
jgi:hypothetical protein